MPGGIPRAVGPQDFSTKSPLQPCLPTTDKSTEMPRSLGAVQIAAIAVAVGLLPLPYGYYMLLRLFLCGLSLYFVSSVPGVRDGEKWVLGGLAVLYNPIVPVELGSKPLWSVINIGTVVWFWTLDRRGPATR